MEIRKYLKWIIKEFFTTFGCLMVIAAAFLVITSKGTISASAISQMIIISLAFTFFKFAFASNFDLGKKAHLISFFTCSTLADLLIVLWLFLAGHVINKDLMWLYIFIILAVKGIVYAMIYYNGYVQAKQFNQRLNDYKKNWS